MNVYWENSQVVKLNYNVFLNNSQIPSSVYPGKMASSRLFFSAEGPNAIQAEKFENNAFLDKYHSNNSKNLFKLAYFHLKPYELMSKFDLSNNYWGTSSSKIIDSIINDYTDDFDLQKIPYTPILNVAPELAYPFVSDVLLSDAIGRPITVVGAESVTFSVTFNRDKF